MKFPLWLSVAVMIAFPPVLRASVRVESPQPSTQKPTITVVYDGKPVAHARLYINTYWNDSSNGKHNKSHWKLVSDAHGQVILPRLPWGIYEVAASSGPTLKGNIFLSMAPPPVDPSYFAFELNLIANWGNPPGLKEASAFSLELYSYSDMEQNFYPDIEQILIIAQKEQLPVTKVAAFQGRVCDMSGAALPRASIEIARMDIPGTTRTIRFKTDTKGKFSASLADGGYIAAFSFSNFNTRIMHLVVSKGARNLPLQIKLEVSESTE